MAEMKRPALYGLGCAATCNRCNRPSIAAPKAAVDVAKVVRELARSTPHGKGPFAYPGGIHLEHDRLDRGASRDHPERVVVVGEVGDVWLKTATAVVANHVVGDRRGLHDDLLAIGDDRRPPERMDRFQFPGTPSVLASRLLNSMS